MKSTFKVLFYLKKNNLRSDGKAPLMTRITIDGTISQFGNKIHIRPNLWDSKNGKLRGRSKIAGHYWEIMQSYGFVTAEKVKNAYLGLSHKQELVRDLFVFSCFTGLGYSDVKNLTNDNVKSSFDDHLWIITRRQKTNTDSSIRLLDVPKRIVEKYRDENRDDRLFRMPNNSYCNRVLKQIAKTCNIKIRLTYHVARHTFATLLTLSQGVPIETVSKLLGHTDIKTTQIYARITREKISQDMDALSQRLELLETQIIRKL